MSFATSLQKRGGAGPSRSFASLILASGSVRYSAVICAFLSALCFPGLLFAPGSAAEQPEPEIPSSSVSTAAAERCSLKLVRLELFAAREDPDHGRITRFSEEEVNSYLDLDLSPEYHPCLKTITATFQRDSLQVEAEIDFDRLETSSTKLFSKLTNLLFSGTHTISARGKLESGNGEACFDLEKALFDDKALPNFLVEKILTAVGQKQDPPFDPMKPSELPYKIDKVDVHPGYIIVYQ